MQKQPLPLTQVAGGTASGKSTVCEKIMETLRLIDQENVDRQVQLNFVMIIIKMVMMVPQVVHISQDSFYRELKGADRFQSILQMRMEASDLAPYLSCCKTLITKWQNTGRARANKGMYNWDHPDAFDNALMERCLRSLKPSTGPDQQSLLFKAMVIG